MSGAPGAFRRMLRAFAAFWGEHGEVLASGMPCPEVAPELVLMAFLQRVVNGSGFIDRDYGVGRGRIALLVHKPMLRLFQKSGMDVKLKLAGGVYAVTACFT